MSIILDDKKAEQVLAKAFEIAKSEREIAVKFADFLKSVFSGTHVTYKYILFTALLAKATNPSINPLSLQAHSQLEGAYDARTLCHSVVVPFERDYLGIALGGSNEPYLNKPARFPELSKKNAVRRGKDQATLFSLCDILPSIDSTQALNGLIYAIRILLEQNKKNISIARQSVLKADSYKQIKDFVKEAAKTSLEGETITLLIGGLYELSMRERYRDYKVEIHPVNQSGSSSKEISDMDIYVNKKLYITNELKDKSFTKFDVEHAINKVKASGFSKLLFIKGANGKLIDADEETLTEEYSNDGFYLEFYTIKEFMKSTLPNINNPSIEVFYKFMIDSAMKNKFKKATITHFQNLAEEFGWINYD